MFKNIINNVLKETYQFDNGFSMKREYDRFTKNGNKFNGRWVMRNEKDEVVAYGFNRNDVCEEVDVSIKY